MRNIRRAQREDVERLHRIYSDAASSTQCLPSIASGDISIEEAPRDEKIIVACDAQGQAVGFVSAFQPGVFIHHLYVAPTYQSQGIGDALLESLMSWLPTPWHLKCVTANARAIKFYRVRGWEQVEKGSGPDGPYIVLRKSAACSQRANAQELHFFRRTDGNIHFCTSRSARIRRVRCRTFSAIGDALGRGTRARHLRTRCARDIRGTGVNSLRYARAVQTHLRAIDRLRGRRSGQSIQSGTRRGGCLEDSSKDFDKHAAETITTRHECGYIERANLNCFENNSR